ncbi:PAS domain-containing sensor histidine kinase [Rhodobacteraceae bacterium 63075]|nr:PAS domain-containing sensor histidine kinase [Rhodobacteraceae bacterium 63075]
MKKPQIDAAIDGPELWAALPLPAVLLGPQDEIEALSPAGEQFMMTSARGLLGKALWDVLGFDADLGRAFARVREAQAPLYVSDALVSVGARPAERCNLRLSPYAEGGGRMLLLISPLEESARLPREGSSRAAVRSAIGMAEMMAHEIKNPLAGITGAAQLLSMSLGDEDRELTDLIVAESRRVVKLLDQVEEFGNLSPPDKRAVNLHDVIDRARRSAALGFGAKLRIVEEYDPSLPPALADADQLLQVLLNLIKNAAEAAGPGGTIRLRTHYEHGFRLRKADGLSQPLPLQIEVIDDGPGIAPDLLAEIFDPFVSGKENGTGLGLALTAKIIAAHDGYVTARSEPGQTALQICLPRAPENAPDAPDAPDEPDEKEG